MNFCYIKDQINTKKWIIISFKYKTNSDIKIFSRKIYHAVLMPCQACNKSSSNLSSDLDSVLRFWNAKVMLWVVNNFDVMV